MLKSVASLAALSGRQSRAQASADERQVRATAARATSAPAGLGRCAGAKMRGAAPELPRGRDVKRRAQSLPSGGGGAVRASLLAPRAAGAVAAQGVSWSELMLQACAMHERFIATVNADAQRGGTPPDMFVRVPVEHGALTDVHPGPSGIAQELARQEDSRALLAAQNAAFELDAEAGCWGFCAIL